MESDDQGPIFDSSEDDDPSEETEVIQGAQTTDPVVGIVEEVVSDPELVRAAQQAVDSEKSGRAPVSRRESGEARVLRVMEEARRSVTREFVRTGSSSVSVRVQVQESSSASVTAPARFEREVTTVPHSVYAALDRDFDYLRGQHAAIRESMGVMAHAMAERAGVSGSEVQSRVRAIEEIAREQLSAMPSTSEYDVEARRFRSLVVWILSELRTVHQPQG